MTSNPKDPRNKVSSPVLFWLGLFLVLACLVTVNYGIVAGGGPFLEMDFVWLETGKIGAQYLSYFNHMEDLFQKPIMLAVRDSKPGEWIFHVFAAWLAGDDPAPRISMVMFLFVLNGFLVGILTYSLFGKKPIGAASALIFILHPQISGAAVTITAAAVQVALFWLLVSFISLLRYKKQGRIYQLAPMICGVFLAYSTHDIGLVALPCLLVLDLVTLDKEWRRKRIETVIGIFARAALVIIPLVSFFFVWIPTTGGRDLARAIVALQSIKLILFAAKQGLQRLIFPLPPNVPYKEVLGGMELGEILVFGLPIILGICLAFVYQNRKGLFPLSLIFFGILFQVHRFVSIMPDSPEYGFPLIIGAMGIAILSGDLLFRIKPKPAAYLAIFTLLCLYGIVGHTGARHWRHQSIQVRTMSSQLAAICDDLSDTSDVFIVSAGKHTPILLAAHLHYGRNNHLDKKLRFSFIRNGKIFPSHKGGPIGQSPTGLTRLQLDESMIFIGYGKNGDMVNLTPVFKQKMDMAMKIIEKEKRVSPKWALGPQSVVQQWGMGMNMENLMPVDNPWDLGWFIEGFILHLHPKGGRSLY